MIGFPLGCCEVAEVQGLRPSSAAKADALCEKKKKRYIIKTDAQNLRLINDHF